MKIKYYHYLNARNLLSYKNRKLFYFIKILSIVKHDLIIILINILTNLINPTLQLNILMNLINPTLQMMARLDHFI